MKIRIATRKSALALWQAKHVAARLADLPGVGAVELVPMSTRGDEILDRSLQKIGGKGLFIKELELAMQRGEADIAVHSMKDVPAEMPDGFCLAAMLERANHADALVAPGGKQLSDLPDGALIGSSSLRRQAQLRMLRPDLRIEPLRGNVNTRLAKLDAGDYDAIILAAAGLERLGFEDRISQQFTPDEMLPAAAQGVVGIECLDTAAELREVLALLDHPASVQTTLAERAIARVLEASCQSPVATYARLDGDAMTVRALVAMPDGSEYIRDSVSGAAQDAEALGERLAARLLEQGAAALLAATEANND
ncbi:MAG: hydroxymethylbilane synthase [Gammaproteobacteria bacterium]|nr:hydroxymethylbilane synthase [Gammaproteobacteria bacterium]NNF50587.1 hydroxymethylbilane synthase [Woeseiaceae bacterium]MBT8093236.1 hydroxymethylbilane synthase [Gammaproteobacteria bacterium]MBT8106042.1 hydroxymethylbilane synthase [Gammaproteobacteria bacterium]NNK26056.1 hydroxymethylbilane synthase [Woeseiaceae bacterium]